jgi:O-methyltransferase
MHHANRALRRVGVRSRFHRGLNPIRDMSVVEHRLNLFHLADEVCGYEIPGEFLEMGTFVGETALVIAKVLHGHGRGGFHVYDSFEYAFGAAPNPRETLEANFRSASLPLPSVHAGRFEVTVPRDLPSRIAFAHIDCGTGGDAQAHRAVVLSLLGHLYPRMASGGVMAFMDYRGTDATTSFDANHGATVAVDEFFEGKHETVCGLYSGEGAMGFVRIARRA